MKGRRTGWRLFRHQEYNGAEDPDLSQLEEKYWREALWRLLVLVIYRMNVFSLRIYVQGRIQKYIYGHESNHKALLDRTAYRCVYIRIDVALRLTSSKFYLSALGAGVRQYT